MIRMKRKYMLIGLLAIAPFLSGCGKADQPATGENVTVQFRRDALGSAHTLPIGPMTDSLNGATLSLKGKLLKVNEDWVVLEYQKLKHWISRDSVLLIRVNK